MPFYSAYAGRLADPDEVTRTEFWTGQLTRPVRFEAGLSALLLQHRDAVLLEVGSGTTLTGLARHSPHASSARTVATLGDGPGDRADVLTAAARLWLSGCPVNWSHAEMPPPAVRVPLPGYPYARDRHWADLPVETAPVQAGDVAPARVEAVPAPVEAPAAPVSTVRWVEGERTGDTSGRSGERALVILPAAPPAAIDVLLAVRRAGLQPVAVRPGDGYAEGGDGFRVRPGEQADLESVLARLADAGRVPDVLVHAATYGAEPDEPLDAQLKHGFYSLMALSRLVVTSNQWTVQPRLVLLTSHSVDVSGGERVMPARVALHGLFRTVAAESPRTACTAIDATGRVPVSELASEIAFGTTAPVVALRGNRRWLPTELPLPLPPATGRALRERGVYLIAGGTGGLGLEVARGLAATGLQPRLALLGRRGNDGVDEAELAALADCGAQVRVYPCDVTDLEGLRQTVEDVTSRFGPVAGVFHLAGVPGERMLAFREPADAKAVLAPKTAGTANLAAVFADRPAPDFTVYFSSRAAVEGLVGGADYAAANAFLDGVAVEGAASGALSIGWPVWRDAGMAATGDVDIATLHRAVRQLDSGQAAAPEAGPAVVVKREMGSATDWVLDEHRVGRMPLLPATAYIDLAVTAYREQVVRGAAPIELSDMVFHTPLLDRAPRTLRITFGPVDGRHDLRMESRPAGDGGAWTVHATGRIRAVEGTPERVDLASLRRRFTAAGAPGGRPRGQTKSRLLKLSPRWDNIADLLALPDERLLCIELPAPYRDEVAGHSLHPALLDTATAAGVRTPEQASSVPFHYQRLVVYGSLPARFHAHARRDTAAPAETPSGDIDLIDDDGTVLATITGFTMIMVDEQRLTASAKAASAPSHATQPAAAPARDGLPSDTGVDIMFRLLDAGVTGHVLVRPFVSGAPAPLASVPAPGVREPALPPREPVPPARESAPAAQIAPVAPAPVAEGLEGRLLALWQQALGATDIRPDQDFFESGGNSLSAIELMALIREEFGADLRVGLLLESRTFGDLCAALRDRGLE
ncbi:SDR family NAD(P)-dependent oxidoreductase [Phytohabitans houttuyneae]|uniref:Uncharacterized protein n=1 Tax=Phytohabitans houttuyneae TaxID=1076126 RepID=A0A6V8K3F7_9ACTN|nr:SDR family NAD(P)-dependent oxidoreductase [Phytohabitans houttuyneae]GFJ78050.1 hypothetical protein Phou_022300 [Phytohabitans houttuyneae]